MDLSLSLSLSLSLALSLSHDECRTIYDTKTEQNIRHSASNRIATLEHTVAAEHRGVYCLSSQSSPQILLLLTQIQ